MLLMADQSNAGRGEPRAGTIGTALSEALVLLLTAAIGATIVALLIFAPRAFFRTEASLATYLEFVRDYLLALLRGNLVGSTPQASAHGELLTAARHSLELLGVSLAVALPLGVGWGALLSTVRRRAPALLLFGLTTLFISLPSFVVMLLAMEGIANLTLRTGVRLTYIQGYGLDQHLILPVSVLALRGAAFMARSIQVAQEDILRQDWIRVARAKGLGGMALWRRHVLPALRSPVLGGTLGMLRVMVSAMVIVDYMSGWGGLGRKVLRVNYGIVNPADDQVIAGAAMLLLIFFIGVDALGRLALRGADPRLRDGVSER
jgi:ABC-type dipeptide/oligopeptide/nickel transport system permease component